MPARLFLEWMAFSQLEPWDEERMDLRFADLMALYANAHKGKSSTRARPGDFMRQWDVDPKERASKRSEGLAKAAALDSKLAAALAKRQKVKAEKKRAEREKRRAAKAEARSARQEIATRRRV
jgi:hypothetical protein